MSRRIDFNCDLGEGCGNDAAILPHITSVNIACGAHAGDVDTMRATLRLCRLHHVAAGAHPGYADRANFGRHDMALTRDQVIELVTEQLARLATLADEEGVRIGHIKPHGALYNLAARNRATADAIAEAVVEFDPSLILVGLSGSQLPAAGRARGLQVAHEVFAERGYDADGRLLPRGTPGAVIESLADALAQVKTMINEGSVIGSDGSRIALQADTLCLHGDRADAPEFACALRKALESAGIEVEPLQPSSQAGEGSANAHL